MVRNDEILKLKLKKYIEGMFWEWSGDFKAELEYLPDESEDDNYQHYDLTIKYQVGALEKEYYFRIKCRPDESDANEVLFDVYDDQWETCWSAGDIFTLMWFDEIRRN